MYNVILLSPMFFMLFCEFWPEFPANRVFFSSFFQKTCAELHTAAKISTTPVKRDLKYRRILSSVHPADTGAHRARANPSWDETLLDGRRGAKCVLRDITLHVSVNLSNSPESGRDLLDENADFQLSG